MAHCGMEILKFQQRKHNCQWKLWSSNPQLYNSNRKLVNCYRQF